MNTAKTKFMLFNNERMQQPVIDINLKINDETIPRVNSTNFLKTLEEVLIFDYQFSVHHLPKFNRSDIMELIYGII